MFADLFLKYFLIIFNLHVIESSFVFKTPIKSNRQLTSIWYIFKWSFLVKAFLSLA